MKLDKKDKQLLDLLYQDSRMSYTALGKRLHLGSRAVEKRLARLKEAGIITGLFANVNFMKLGIKTCRLYLKFDSMDTATEQELLKFFEDHPHTFWGTVCEGEYDALLRFAARSESDIENLTGHVIQKFGARIIEKTLVTTIHQTYLSWNKSFETARRPPFPTEKIGPVESPDETDLKILSALYRNGRETTVRIAEQVGLTPDAVQRRMRRLIGKQLILGYTGWFDSGKLGFNLYKLLIGFRNVTPDKEKEFLSFCSQKNDIVFIAKTVGSWDVEADIIVRNNRELHHFMLDLKARFGPLIGKHQLVSPIEERLCNPLKNQTLNRKPATDSQ